MVPRQLDLLDTLNQQAKFSKFSDLLRRFDLVEFFKLRGRSKITVLALTNKVWISFFNR